MAELIPIKNIYYLFCYAWNSFAQGAAIDVGGIDSPELVDLLAKVLIGGIEKLLRRGIDRNYVPTQQEIRTVRGRVKLDKTIPLLAERRGSLICEFDEFREDTPNNQILKASIVRLLKCPSLDVELAARLRSLHRRFGMVSDARLKRDLFRTAQVHRNNSVYAFLLKVCELIFDCALPTEEGGWYKFEEVTRDEVKMRKVFQDFVRNFFALNQKEFLVSAPTLDWDAGHSPIKDHELLPTMRTDVVLRSANRCIIIDTKYYADTMQSYFGKKTVHSANLYQIFSYVKNAERVPGFGKAEGWLIYPTVKERVRFKAELQGHPIKAVTINLDHPWKEIEAELLGLLSY